MDAANRLERVMKALGFVHSDESALEYSRRVRVIWGDLEEPFFGVGDDVWDVVARLVDAIYHCGSKVCAYSLRFFMHGIRMILIPKSVKTKSDFDSN